MANSQEDLAQLRNLREAWGIAVDGPLVVIGRITGRLREDQPDVFYLEDLCHAETGHGLSYPLSGERATKVFIPPATVRRWRTPEEAVTGNHWAIAELILAPQDKRQLRSNPQECNVRPGTLRPLSSLPSEWHVQVHETVSGAQIVEHARAIIAADLASAAVETELILTNLANKIDTDQRRIDEAQVAIADLQEQRRIEQELLDQFRIAAERETKDMEERYRRLQRLLFDKGQRLVALGLIDVEDLAVILPSEFPAAEREGWNLVRAFDGDLASLAPWIQAKLARSGLLYSQAQVRNFVALLRSRDLVMLAGDSGSGKTSLVRAFAEAIGGVCTVIPVKPNWTGPEDLLGYYNPIDRSYHPTSFLLALQAAAAAPETPHFICLDEMNLARVEHYFADFLSLLENRATAPDIQLYTADEERHMVMEQAVFLELEAEARRRAGMGEEATFEDILINDQANAALRQLGGFSDGDGILRHHARLRREMAAQMRTPTSILFPENVWIFGAINMDETTYHLSPKVLDRVHVMRFANPMLANWNAIKEEIAVNDEQRDLSLSIAASELGSRQDYPTLDLEDAHVAFLATLSRDFLDPMGIEFGLRAVRQAQGYLAAANSAGIRPDKALDNVIRQKVLPKIAFDMSRVTADGRSRRDVLVALRDALEERLGGTENAVEGESAVKELDRLITLSDGNHGVVNYWMR